MPCRTAGVCQLEGTPGTRGHSKSSLIFTMTKKKTMGRGGNKGKKETKNSSMGVYDDYLLLTGVKFQE